MKGRLLRGGDGGTLSVQQQMGEPR